MNEDILEVKDLQKHFPLRYNAWIATKARVHAIDGVSFKIRQGETLGLVGESGSGKTTVGRCILRLSDPTSGSIRFNGVELTDLPLSSMKKVRRHLQFISQDPYGSLTPRMRVAALLREPLKIHGMGTSPEQKERVAEMLSRVGLRPEHATRFPHELSGGQRQRVAIARSLMLNPLLVVADEPVSALDVSIQAQILNLMARLQREMKLSYLFISHDLSVIKYMADRIAVMYLGKIVELAGRDALFNEPRHPYTHALISAIPISRPGEDSQRTFLEGEIPSPIDPPRGCRFHTRCTLRRTPCDEVEPGYRDIGGAHFVACHWV